MNALRHLTPALMIAASLAAAFMVSVADPGDATQLAQPAAPAAPRS